MELDTGPFQRRHFRAENHLRASQRTAARSEAQHFWKCGGWLDLDEVLEHEEPLPHPAYDQVQ
jgi:hypothetical protein